MKLEMLCIILWSALFVSAVVAVVIQEIKERITRKQNSRIRSRIKQMQEDFSDFTNLPVEEVMRGYDPNVEINALKNLGISHEAIAKFDNFKKQHPFRYLLWRIGIVKELIDSK